jgi:hypothetical protein
MYIVL